MKIQRRDALRYMAAGTAALGVSSLFPVDVFAATPDLAVVNGEDPAANVRAAINALGGMSKFVSKGDKVAIKPNMGFGNAPNKATTTEPKVIRALAEEALNAGAKRVMIFDHPCHKPKIVLDICGIKNELSGLSDAFVYTIQDAKFYREVQMKDGVALKKQKIAVDILEADTIINVPVAKSHGATKVSFGMKNWMGAVLQRRYWHFGINLHQGIADIAKYIKPKLTVLDATRGLLTGGPGGPGKISNLKTIVAGVDPVAVDAYGVTLAPWGGSGYKVDQIPHIVKAAALGVGSYDIEKMVIYKKHI